MILTAFTDLAGFVKILTEAMVEAKSDIAGMKKTISSIKQEMKQMNGKIDTTYNIAIAQRIDDKLMLLSVDFVGIRADVLALQLAK